MKQAQVTKTLKRLLKNQKILYKDIAARIQTTESAIKNIFYSETISLEKLLEILEAIPFEVTNFFKLVEANENIRFSFTEAQELFFAENISHFQFFEEVFFARKDVAFIKENYGLNEISMHRYIRDIEKQGIWTYRGNDSFVFHVSGPLNWRQNGPWMQKYYYELTSQQVRNILNNKSNDSDLV